ncbi:MAG: type II toxin-antitoxin system PemK/MazF family toxin [Ignavibacteriae bacterium]|nr:type II toxin-antitoxin system PemK/MazF family toxin [Ignavibacteriota bacterium]MCB9215311.1 type II toxin-antitoxin system PemK/MazF family toxin [Ignavibacteria bacterium]
MSRIDPVPPKYGEVWLVESREEESASDLWPAVVISSDAMEQMPLRLVAKIKNFQKGSGLWCVEVPQEKSSGLDQPAVVDAMQICSIETGRCRKRLGRLPADCMVEVAAAVAILVEHE